MVDEYRKGEVIEVIEFLAYNLLPMSNLVVLQR